MGIIKKQLKITMKKLLLAAFILISLQTFSQKGQSSISFGPSFASPMSSSTTDYFKTGIGAGLRGYYGVSKHGSLMFNVNYVSFGYKPKYTISYSLTSFKAGYKTFIGNNFYVYGDAGIVLLSAKDKLSSNPFTSTALGLGAGFGYSYPVTKNSYIDISPSLNFNNSGFGRRLSAEVNISYRINL